MALRGCPDGASLLQKVRGTVGQSGPQLGCSNYCNRLADVCYNI